MRGIMKIPIPSLPSLKELLVILVPDIGLNNEYGNPVEYSIASNEAVIGIDVIFDGITMGEVQTLELTIVFDDGTQRSQEYTCTSDQLACKYTLTPYDIFLFTWIEDGRDVGLYIRSETYTHVNIFQKKIVKIMARAKTSLSMPYGVSSVALRILRVT